MIRWVLCWLGFHKWVPQTGLAPAAIVRVNNGQRLSTTKFEMCKHCPATRSYKVS